MLTTLLTAAGCRFGPNYRAPAAPTPPAFTGAAAASASEQQAIAHSDWWKVFHDPELDRIDMETDGANRDIRVSINRVDEALASTGYARSFLFPTVAAQPSVSRNARGADQTQQRKHRRACGHLQRLSAATSNEL